MGRKPAPAPCRLCLRIAELRLSHVIPEFLHAPLYDEIHRLNVVRARAGHVDQTQKGDRERLLCDGCEQLLNKNYEQYFLKVWPRKVPTLIDVAGHKWTLCDLNYVSFKLFHLSILWRSSVARSVFRGFSLPAQDEEQLRQMLLNRQPGPVERFQIVAVLLLSSGTRKVCHTSIMAPCITESAGRLLYTFVFGGCAWLYFPDGSGHPVLDKLALTPAGNMELPVRDFYSMPHVQRFVQQNAAQFASSLLVGSRSRKRTDVT